ncbi:MAG: T9SS type A sorting domain-containing protein [Ferruginibacter sp.]
MKNFTILLFTIFSFSTGYSQSSIEQVLQSWSNGNWVNSTKFTSSYDTNCYLIHSLSQTWDATTSSWLNSGQTSYTNNSSGKQLTTLDQSWSAGAWQNSSRSTYTYDAANNMLTAGFDYFDNGNWINGAINTYTYDAGGRATGSYQVAWDANSNSWINDSKNILTYDSNGDNTESVSQAWDEPTGTWIDYQYAHSVYNSAHKLMERTLESTVTGNWANYSKELITRDNNGFRTAVLSQMWDAASNNWQNRSMSTYTLNPDGSIAHWVTQSWNVAAGAWVFSSQGDVPQGCVRPAPPTGVAPDPTTTSILVYPNPTTDRLNIVLADYGKAQYSITDLQGRVVKTGAFNDNKASIDITDLPENMYFINVLQGEKKIGKKFIKH